MSFVSFQFFILVALTVLIYYLVPKNYRWYVLLAASCYFYYVSAGWQGTLVALATIALTYGAGRWIEATKTETKKKAKFILVAAVIVLVGIVTVVKLKNYYGWSVSWLIVPLGVSYYSFSLVGYLADIYWKKDHAETNFLKLALYTLYFPKIIQGPISKFREIGPRLIEGHTFDYRQFCFGLQLMLFGFFKKIVIADRVYLLTQNVFTDFKAYAEGGAILFVSTFLAIVRHYCDWSGYMDIVIGVSELMGIKLEDNFKQPFFSKSAAEFWRRWHITLGVWFKDYVYMPLVISPRVIKISNWFRKHFGKRAGKAVLSVIPLAITWILTGLWHGTGKNYLIWGIYWGSIIIISNVFAPELQKLTKLLRINPDSADFNLFRILRTFCIFSFGLLISTFVGTSGLKKYFRTLIFHFCPRQIMDGTIYTLGITREDMIILIVSIIILFIVEVMQQKYKVREEIAKLNGFWRWLIYAAMFVYVIYFGMYGGTYSTTGFTYAFF